ncbi:MAG: hypothetical protein LLF86_02395 [Nitrospiraceae bacterium]|nr:hypothetical protein [Nitrospiraceae bacterium]
MSNGLILATLDTSRQIKPSDVKKAERLVSNLVAGFEPDLGFEPISDEIYEASGSKVVFLLIQRHYPLLKKGALSWLVDKAIFRAKLAEKKARAADEQFNSSRPEICSTLLDQDSQQIADISSTAKITQEESSYIPKGSIRMRLN